MHEVKKVIKIVVNASVSRAKEGTKEVPQRVADALENLISVSHPMFVDIPKIDLQQVLCMNGDCLRFRAKHGDEREFRSGDSKLENAKFIFPETTLDEEFILPQSRSPRQSLKKSKLNRKRKGKARQATSPDKESSEEDNNNVLITQERQLADMERMLAAMKAGKFQHCMQHSVIHNFHNCLVIEKSSERCGLRHAF